MLNELILRDEEFDSQELKNLTEFNHNNLIKYLDHGIHVSENFFKRMFLITEYFKVNYGLN